MRVVIRLRRRRDAAGRFLFGSIGAHSMVLALILVVPSLRGDSRPKEALMVVELAGSIPAAPAAGSAAPEAAAPLPAREPEGAHAVKEVPPPPKKKPPAPKEDKPKPADPPRETTPPGTAAGTGGQDAGPATGSGSGPATGTPGITSLDNADPGLAWYNASVTGALQAVWVRPVLEGTRQVLSVVVSFEIDRSGQARDVRIDTASGVPSLDRSALRAVADAAPFPRPPAGHDAVRQRIRFDLIPESF